MSEAPNGYDDDKAEATELLIGELLREHGWKVTHAPSTDKNAPEEAPMHRGCDSSTVRADIVGIGNGKAIRVECKYKATGAEYIKKNDQQEHFIDKDNWDDYQEVRSASGDPVWLFIYELDDYTLLYQEIDKIEVAGYWTEPDVNENNGDKYGNEGRFLKRECFKRLRLSQQHAPENFFGQSRLSGSANEKLSQLDLDIELSDTQERTDGQSGLEAF
jgi:hypothetical protein